MANPSTNSSVKQDDWFRFETQFASLPRKPGYAFFLPDIITAEVGSGTLSRWDSLQAKLVQYLPPAGAITSVEWFESDRDWWVRMRSDRDFSSAMDAMRRKQSHTIRLLVQSTAPKPPPTPAAAPVAAVAAPPVVTPSRTHKRAMNVAAAGSKPAKKSSHNNSVADRVLRAFVELHVLKITTPPRIQVALFSGYTNITSTGFANAMRDFVQEELVALGPNQTASLTPAGVAAASERCPEVQQPKTNADVQTRLQQLLPGKPTQLIQLLSDGAAHERMAICTAMGYTNITSTGFAEAVRRLQSLGLLQVVTKKGEKCLVLTDLLFPFGRKGRQREGTMMTPETTTSTGRRSARKMTANKKYDSASEGDEEDHNSEFKVDEESGEGTSDDDDDDEYMPDRTISSV